jgi:hypothetical protein
MLLFGLAESQTPREDRQAEYSYSTHTAQVRFQMALPSVGIDRIVG